MNIPKKGLYKSTLTQGHQVLVLDVTEPDEDNFYLVTIDSGNFSQEITSDEWLELAQRKTLAFARDLTSDEENIGITFL